MTPALRQFIYERVDEGWAPEDIAIAIRRWRASASHSRIIMVASAYQRSKIEAHIDRLRAREARRRAAIAAANSHPYIVGVLARQAGAACSLARGSK